MTSQGINGAVYALMALDACGADDNVKEKYLDYILNCQLEDGGWAVSGNAGDADMTAMAVQALAQYKDRPTVCSSIEKAMDRLDELQNSDGGYSSFGTPNCESCAQVILAKCSLGLTPEENLTNALLSYQLEDGSFSHTLNGNSSIMATAQALMALTEICKRNMVA